MNRDLSFKDRCQQYLSERWDSIVQLFDQAEIVEPLSNGAFELKEKIRECLTSNIKSYRYVLPTQLLSKSVDNTLDCRSLQVADESEGSFDARTIAEKFKLFDIIKREKINAADASSGMVADIECYLNNEIVLLVEVKDRSLNLTQLNAKIDIARSNQIKEIIFMAQQGIEESNKAAVQKKITQEFTSGQNIYVADLLDFSNGIMILLGEIGRINFLNKIGPELDESKSPIKHRKAWANLLREI